MSATAEDRGLRTKCSDVSVRLAESGHLFASREQALSTHSGHSRVSVADLHRAHRAAVGREAGVADRRPVL